MLQLAQPADWEAINGLALQLNQSRINWRPDLYMAVEPMYEEERFLMEIRSRSLYVAKLSDTVIGYIRLVIQKNEAPGELVSRNMVVSELCVDEPYRNQGYGLAMMEDARALAKAFGCKDLRLAVYPQNDEAVNFFQKCGFTIHRIDMQRFI